MTPHRHVSTVAALLAVCLLGSCSDSPPDVETMLADIQAKARASGEAVQKRDFEAFVDLAYPPLTEKAGGREAMIKLMDQAAQGYTMQSFEVRKPTGVHSSGENLFAVVPTVAKLNVGGKITTLDSFLLAISSDQGRTWHFLDGSGLDDAKDVGALPKLPEDLKLPATGLRGPADK